MKISIYTDGSCSGNPGPGGWAVIISSQDGIKTIKGYDISTTNNKMELRAIIEACKWILKQRNKNPKAYYHIISDSAYVVNAINNNWLESWQKKGWKTTGNKYVKNIDMWQEFVRVRAALLHYGIKYQFIKVKGHSNDQFNNMADETACEMTERAKLELQSGYITRFDVDDGSW